MKETPKKNWFTQHPILGSFLGFIAVATVVSAFDSGDTADYKANIYNPTSVVETQTTNHTPIIYTTPTPLPKSQSNCHPSYSGCLKADAYDYDCAGGSGNGPYYTGRVRVYGYDEFGLDRDGDGIGCE